MCDWEWLYKTCELARAREKLRPLEVEAERESRGAPLFEFNPRLAIISMTIEEARKRVRDLEWEVRELS